MYLNEYSEQWERIEESLSNLIPQLGKKIHLIPFRMVKGFIKLTNTGEKSILYKDKDFSTIWNIKASNEPIIAYWEKTFHYRFYRDRIEKAYSKKPIKEQTGKAQKDFQPYYFEAWVEDYSQNNNVGSISINGKEHTIVKTLTTLTLIVKAPNITNYDLYLNNDNEVVKHDRVFKQWSTEMIKDYLFIIPDEHAQSNQWLMITDFTPIYSPSKKEYQGARVVLTNVSDLFSSSGRDILSMIQPGQPGDGYLWPKIVDGVLTYDEAKEPPTGVRSIQIQTNAPFALNSLLITGRTYNENLKALGGNKRLLLYEGKVPITSKIFNLSAPTTKYVMLHDTKFEIEKIWKDKYEHQKQHSGDIETKPTINGGLLIPHKWNHTNNQTQGDFSRYVLNLWDKDFTFNLWPKLQDGGELTESNWNETATKAIQGIDGIVGTLLETPGRVAMLSTSPFFVFAGLGKFNAEWIAAKIKRAKNFIDKQKKGMVILPGTTSYDYLNHNSFMYDLIKYLPYSYKETIRQNYKDLVGEIPIIGGLLNKFISFFSPGTAKLMEASSYGINNFWLDTRGFNFIAPALAMELASNLRENENEAIDLDIFTDSNTKTQAPLGAPVMSCAYHFEITDRFAKMINNKYYIFDTENLGQTHYRDGTQILERTQEGELQPLYWDSTCFAVPFNTPLAHTIENNPINFEREANKRTNYLIDTIEIKGLGKSDIVITTFTSNETITNFLDETQSNFQAILESTAKYSGDMTHWSTMLNFSTINEWNIANDGITLDYPKPPQETNFLKEQKKIKAKNVGNYVETNQKLFSFSLSEIESASLINNNVVGYYDRALQNAYSTRGNHIYSDVFSMLENGTKASEILENDWGQLNKNEVYITFDEPFDVFYDVANIANRTKTSMYIEFEIISHYMQTKAPETLTSRSFKFKNYNWYKADNNEKTFIKGEPLWVESKMRYKAPEKKTITLKIPYIDNWLKTGVPESFFLANVDAVKKDFEKQIYIPFYNISTDFTTDNIIWEKNKSYYQVQPDITKIKITKTDLRSIKIEVENKNNVRKLPTTNGVAFARDINIDYVEKIDINKFNKVKQNAYSEPTLIQNGRVIDAEFDLNNDAVKDYFDIHLYDNSEFLTNEPNIINKREVKIRKVYFNE